jgi:hypothetical protein
MSSAATMSCGSTFTLLVNMETIMTVDIKGLRETIERSIKKTSSKQFYCGCRDDESALYPKLTLR